MEKFDSVTVYHFIYALCVLLSASSCRPTLRFFFIRTTVGGRCPPRKPLLTHSLTRKKYKDVVSVSCACCVTQRQKRRKPSQRLAVQKHGACRPYPTRRCVSCFIPRLDPLFSLSVCTLPYSSADREAPSVLYCEQSWRAMEGVLLLPGNKARSHWHCKSQQSWWHQWSDDGSTPHVLIRCAWPSVYLAEYPQCTGTAGYEWLCGETQVCHFQGRTRPHEEDWVM